MSDSVEMKEMAKLLEKVRQEEWSKQYLTTFFINILHAEKSENLELFLLRYMGVNPIAGDNYPLRAAAASGHKQTVYELLQRGANANADGRRALINAIERENAEIAEILLHEIELSVQGSTAEEKEKLAQDLTLALNVAVGKNFDSITERVLKLGAKPVASLLTTAVRKRNHKIVDLLFMYGINQSKHYKAALGDSMLEAIEQGDEAMVRKLTMMGADATNGIYIIKASQKGFTKLVEFFARMSSGKSRDFMNKAMEWALLSGHLDTVLLLQKLGADPTIEFVYRLRATARKGYTDIVKYLINLKPSNLAFAADRALHVLEGCNVKEEIISMLKEAAISN